MTGAKKRKLNMGRAMLGAGVIPLVVSMMLNEGTLRWVSLIAAFAFFAAAIVTFMKAGGEPD
jgi:hypothetical protein